MVKCRCRTELRYVQAVKNGGKESDELVLADIAAYVVSEMEEHETYIMGSGSTVAAVMAEMGLENTLLGVDVVKDQELVAQDQTASQLLDYVDEHSKIVITLIGGQGHIFGRGNQQLEPRINPTGRQRQHHCYCHQNQVKSLSRQAINCRHRR